MSLKVKACGEKEFESIKSLIIELNLDGRDLERKNFLLIEENHEVLAFGRIIEHPGYSELCSLGVLFASRSKGLGKELVIALRKKATQPLFLISIIPSYFESLGFSVSRNFPPQLEEKLSYCRQTFPGAAEYLVMEYN